MTSTFLLGAIIGLLIGLVYCYWKQISFAYQNRDLLSSGANLASAAQDFYQKL